MRFDNDNYLFCGVAFRHHTISNDLDCLRILTDAIEENFTEIFTPKKKNVIHDPVKSNQTIKINKKK